MKLYLCIQSLGLGGLEFNFNIGFLILLNSAILGSDKDILKLCLFSNGIIKIEITQILNCNNSTLFFINIDMSHVNLSTLIYYGYSI